MRSSPVTGGFHAAQRVASVSIQGGESALRALTGIATPITMRSPSRRGRALAVAANVVLL